MIPASLIEAVDSIESSRTVVGLSGGVDSVALLHAMKTQSCKPVAAIHVNHQISERADDWQGFCETLCESLNVTLTVKRVTVAEVGNLEHEARLARYTAFEEVLQPDDLLLLAHHQDDQLETIFLNLFRGSAEFGVRGMQSSRPVGSARLFRPLLELSKEAILAYARAHDLRWIDDDSNQNIDFDRNFLRHRLLPMIAERFPSAADALVQAADRDGEFVQLVDSKAESDLAAIQDSDGGIDLNGLLMLTPQEQMMVLRFRVKQCSESQPTRKALLRFLGSLGDDEMRPPCLYWQGLGYEVFDGKLHLIRDHRSTTLVEDSLSLTEPFKIGEGELTNKSVKGKGVLLPDKCQLTVKPRQGGERIRLGRNKTLKNLLQERRVPHWLRARLPLVYVDNKLVCIPAVPEWGIKSIIADGHAAEDDERGVSFAYEPHDKLF